jgi:hypothetical protein
MESTQRNKRLAEQNPMMAKDDELSTDGHELQGRQGVGKTLWQATEDQVLAVAFGASSTVVFALIALTLFLLWNWL